MPNTKETQEFADIVKFLENRYDAQISLYVYRKDGTCFNCGNLSDSALYSYGMSVLYTIKKINTDLFAEIMTDALMQVEPEKKEIIHERTDNPVA